MLLVSLKATRPSNFGSFSLSLTSYQRAEWHLLWKLIHQAMLTDLILDCIVLSKRSLVRGLAPPERGGVLNLPADLLSNPVAVKGCGDLCELITNKRRELGLPDLRTFYVDREGNTLDSH